MNKPISAFVYGDRNSDIYMERKNGKTLEEIGNKYGISKERVRQICEKKKKRLDDRYPLLPVRVKNAIFNAGLTVEEVRKMPKEKIMEIKTIGEKYARMLNGGRSLYNEFYLRHYGEDIGHSPPPGFDLPNPYRNKSNCVICGLAIENEQFCEHFKTHLNRKTIKILNSIAEREVINNGRI